MLLAKVKKCCKNRNVDNKQVHTDMGGSDVLHNNSEGCKNKGTIDDMNENNMENTLSAWLSNEN